ncbi:Alpha/Beta hydrolase protein [Mycena olivaceomarginata]|nr:Alpha/Beta hydrolase protein [Mycena olivaceomarginata]
MFILGVFKSRSPSNTTDTGWSLPSHATHPVGCEILERGAEPIVADIVFVHGLRGHPRSTWTKDKTCWPKDLLPRYCAQFYDANIANFLSPASQNSIFEHSKNLLNHLDMVRDGEAKTRPIIFVAHSLGGILALCQSRDAATRHPDVGRIYLASRGIIFLGTPHRGSGMASLGEIIAKIAHVSLKATNQKILQGLKSDAETLSRITEPFKNILSERTVAIYSFAEELDISSLRGFGRVVPPKSAFIDDPYERTGTIHADHIGMAKFGNKDDPGFCGVVHAIKKILERNEEQFESQTLCRVHIAGNVGSVATRDATIYGGINM